MINPLPIELHPAAAAPRSYSSLWTRLTSAHQIAIALPRLPTSASHTHPFSSAELTFDRITPCSNSCWEHGPPQRSGILFTIHIERGKFAPWKQRFRSTGFMHTRRKSAPLTWRSRRMAILGTCRVLQNSGTCKLDIDFILTRRNGSKTGAMIGSLLAMKEEILTSSRFAQRRFSSTTTAVAFGNPNACSAASRRWSPFSQYSAVQRRDSETVEFLLKNSCNNLRFGVRARTASLLSLIQFLCPRPGNRNVCLLSICVSKRRKAKREKNDE
jgi:hypothetical protein